MSAANDAQVQLVSAAIDALMVEFAPRIDAEVTAQVLALQQWLQQQPEVVELVPSYRCLLVYYQPLTHSEAQLRAVIARGLAATAEAALPQGQQHVIEVCYEPELGLDLTAVAERLQQPVEQIIAWHTEPNYLVYTLGFAPGFAYMGEVPEPLRLPRLATPRQVVPALSVAIANQQTAIYPDRSPGGWLILGQALALPELQAGDRVQFQAISRAEFDQRRGQA